MKASFETDVLIVDVETEPELDRLGSILSRLFEPGDVVSLDGPLGAGKTRLVRAITAALDCRQLWAGSPTFILVQEYAGRLPIYHMDAYRLKDSHEFRGLGGEDYLWGDGVCLIEWAERIRDVLPDDTFQVTIEVVSPTSRRLRLSASRGRSLELLSRIARELTP
jgi:tRNA threonylcarbamoyladenosine biosynthesis protein TsaE